MLLACSCIAQCEYAECFQLSKCLTLSFLGYGNQIKLPRVPTCLQPTTTQPPVAVAAAAAAATT